MLPPLTLRPATVTDAPEIARLLTLLGHPTPAERVAADWPAWAAAGNSAYVVARPDGSLAGLVTLGMMRVLHRPRPVGRITALIVDAELRGQGLGRALVAEAERILTAAGCGLLEITSHNRLTEAHRFYEALGYEQTSKRFGKVLPPLVLLSRQPEAPHDHHPPDR